MLMSLKPTRRQVASSIATAGAGAIGGALLAKLDGGGAASERGFPAASPATAPNATIYARPASDRADEYGSLLDVIPRDLQSAVGAGDISTPLDHYINAFFDHLRATASPVYPTGRRIRWPAGRIRLENALNILGLHNVKQAGPGAGALEVIQTNNFPVFAGDLTAAQVAGGAAGLARHSIEDMTIHGAWGANQNSNFNRAHGISTRYSNSVAVRRVDFRGCNRMWNIAFAVGNKAEWLTSPIAQAGNPMTNKYGLFQCGINPEYDNNSVHGDHNSLSAQEVVYRMICAHGTSHTCAVGLSARVGMMCGRSGEYGDGEDPTDVPFPKTQFVYPHINDAEMDSCIESGFVFAGGAGGPISRMRMSMLWAANTADGPGVLIDQANGLLISGLQTVYNGGGGIVISNSRYVSISGFIGDGNIRGKKFSSDIAVSSSSYCDIIGGSSQLSAGRVDRKGLNLIEDNDSDYNTYQLKLDKGRGPIGRNSEFLGYPQNQRKASGGIDPVR
ncbi:hypothetical protein [Methylobacterium mesophilicum]|uniref:hypothetical protein n=1 Tax=Methylobacterium mesophilicum TaxID=39956 RepID=UPI002F358AD6